MWLVLAAFLVQSTDYQAQAIKALDARQYDTAVELLNKAVAADPKDYGAQFNLALAYSLSGKDADAIPHYKIALDLKPGLYEAELNLGISMLRAKDASGALPHLNSAAEQKPHEYRPAFYVAQALLETKKFADAEAAYTAALALNPQSAPAELGLAESLARQKKLSESEPHFRKAAALDASYKSMLLQLGELYEQNHQPAEAIAIYREFPDNPGAQERMGALLIEQGRAADAIPALEQAVEKSPTTANRVALAQAYVKNNQPAKAEPLAAQALADQPGDFDLRMFYGRILRDQHKYTAASNQFLLATNQKPDSVKAWNELAGALIIAEQYPQALAALDKVFAMGAQTPSHYYLRAMSYDHLHALKEALANYNKFLELSQGQNPDEEFKARLRARILQNELRR
ncbi:MAG TPA: tetratricopeptide repeat protein [Bryobacteraceae bacterium]|nr:tetratricopeptide repeat protein [Bryobacteraceae bacterium]